MTVLNRVIVRAVNGDITDDYNPVYRAALAFLNGEPVYTANFDSVDPHYLYPPGATMLLSPIAVIDPERSRWLFIIASTIAAQKNSHVATGMVFFAAWRGSLMR